METKVIMLLNQIFIRIKDTKGAVTAFTIPRFVNSSKNFTNRLKRSCELSNTVKNQQSRGAYITLRMPNSGTTRKINQSVK